MRVELSRVDGGPHSRGVESSLVPAPRPRQAMAVCKAGRGLSADAESAGALTLDFSASKCARNHSIVDKATRSVVVHSPDGRRQIYFQRA